MTQSTGPDSPSEKIVRLQNMLIARATGDWVDEEDYRTLRQELLADNSVAPFLPRMVAQCRDLSQFWGFIKPQFPTYRERREYIWGEFASVLDKFEGIDGSPVDGLASDALVYFDADHVYQVWQRALERRNRDPEGAITISRSLLESVCKHILDDMQVAYPDSADLPRLYRLTAEQLNLSPDQHAEQVFRQILGGCQTVVEGLGAIRNRLGDAHGQGQRAVRPSPRHAELAVNLAGTMATFLVRTWENHREQQAE